MTEHCLILSSPIDAQVCASIVTYTNNLALGGASRLTVAISSPGGSVNAGITIYNVLRAAPFKVVAHNIGNVDSIATVIFLAGDERYANSASSFMFHGVAVNPNGSVRMDEAGLEQTLASVRSDNNRIAQIIAERSTLDADGCSDLIKAQHTKGPEWALSVDFIHGVSEFEFPEGADVKHIANA